MKDLLFLSEYIKMADHYVPVPGGTNNNNYANVELILDIAKRIPVQVSKTVLFVEIKFCKLIIVRLIQYFDHYRLCGLVGVTPQKTPNFQSYFIRTALHSWVREVSYSWLHLEITLKLSVSPSKMTLSSFTDPFFRSPQPGYVGSRRQNCIIYRCSDSWNSYSALERHRWVIISVKTTAFFSL